MQKTFSGTTLQPPSFSLNFLYFVCFITNCLVNFDHGIIPAASKEIKSDLNITDFEFGLLGSVVYIGLLVGSVVASFAYMKINTKNLIIFVIITYCFSLFLFLVSNKIIYLGLSRGLVGFFQIFLIIFFPVWVDIHGGTKQTLWLIFLQLGVPLGVFLGYVATSLYIRIMGSIALLIPCGLAMLAFDSSEIDVQMQEEETQAQGQNNQFQKYQNNQSQVFQGRTPLHRLSVEPVLKLTRSRTYMSSLKEIFSNKVFLYTMLTLASMYFVVTGIQFWISDYMRVILKIDQNTVSTSFSIVSISAPTTGALLGGLILDKVGGYRSKGGLNLCLFYGFLASCCAIPIPFLDDFMTIIILLWLLFFFGGSLFPAVTGLMLQSVPKNKKALSNSQAQLFHNLLGNLPSPFLYGFVNKISLDPESRNGMKLLMFWSLWGFIGLFLAKREQDNLLVEFEEKQKQKLINHLEGQKYKNQYLNVDQFSDKIPMSKITEKESEFSQSFIDNASPSDKQQDKQKFNWSQNKDEVNQENLNNPNAQKQGKGINQPLINKNQKSGSFGNLGVGQKEQENRQQQSQKSNIRPELLNFSQIKPQFYKFNQSPKQQNNGINRNSSVAFLTWGSMLGKSSIVYIDDDDETDEQQELAHLQDEELQILKQKYSQEYAQYENNLKK